MTRLAMARVTPSKKHGKVEGMRLLRWYRAWRARRRLANALPAILEGFRRDAHQQGMFGEEWVHHDGS